MTTIGRNVSCLVMILLMVCAGATVRASVAAMAQEEFEGWNLEPGVEKAHLVMVARVVSVGRLTVVQGAKTEVALREYRFQQVRAELRRLHGAAPKT